MLDWNISFINQYWRYLHSGGGFIWSAKLDSRYTSEVENSRGALLPIITTWLCDFDKYLYLKYSQVDVQMSRYFPKSRDHIVMTLLAPGEEFHLYLSPKSYTYATLVTIASLEVKIISTLLYKIINCPPHSTPLPWQ